jgi:hypothetical protein
MGRPDTRVQSPPRVAPVPNNVFAGKDGKVYQRTNGGLWNVNQGRQWVRTQLPQATPVTPAPSRGGGEPGVQKPEARPMAQPQPMTPPQTRPTTQPQTRYQPPSQPRTSPSQPYVPPPTWRSRPTAPPSPPTLAPTPGSLEREFQARQRGGGAPPAMAPARVPEPQQPQKKEPEKEKKKDR